jgi:phosphatidylethanolamine-binding protein (PEBP) family uncharacterized protein
MDTCPQRFPGFVGFLAVASLSFWAPACGGGSNSQGTGDAGMSTGGATATGGASSGGATGSGGAATGGASGGAGTGGVIGSGGAATGGATSSGGAGTGGAMGSGGKTSEGGATSTGGISGGANGGGGKIGGGGTGVGGKASGGAPGSGGTMGGGGTSGGIFTLTSPAWTAMAACTPDMKASCPPLPTDITRSGAGTSPELHWANAPVGTKSFVVMLQDLSGGTAHWILWNIQPTVTMLAANVDQTTAMPAVPAGSQQCGKGTDAATSDGYYGPGAPCNVYEFIVYALSISTFSPTMATDQEMVRTQLKALGTSILGTASLRGRTNTSCN